MLVHHVVNDTPKNNHEAASPHRHRPLPLCADENNAEASIIILSHYTYRSLLGQ